MWRVAQSLSSTTAFMNSSLTRTLLLAFWKKIELYASPSMRGIVAGINQRPGLALFLGLALDEFDDVGVVDVQDHHLRGAARLATGLDDAGKGVITLHERQRP